MWKCCEQIWRRGNHGILRRIDVFVFVFIKKPLLAHASLHEVLSMELHFKIKNIYNSQYKCQYKSPHKSKFANLLTYVNIQIAIV